MNQYKELIKDVLDNGYDSGDRTGTGTKSVFGRQVRFDLSKGFPIVTTKKTYWRGVLVELLWLMRGETNVKFLQDRKVKIWDEWASPEGELGPVYGKSWRDFGSKPESIPQPTPNLRKDLEKTYLGVANGYHKEGHLLKKTWEGMISRCYNKNANMYHLYGGKGVSVCDRWLEFKAFAEDAENLMGWESKEINPRAYCLDKDELGDGFRYSPKNCQWISQKQNNQIKSKYKYTVEKDGIQYTFSNPSAFCEEHGISDKNFSDLWTGKKKAKVRYGYSFVSKESTDLGLDQLSTVIERIKTNPNCRRLIVNAWDASLIKYMKLPPCHAFFQFYVRDGKLSCQLYQRSADLFLGVPFNIASYAALTHLIANECGLEVGEFVHTFGDLHLYNNHLDQAKELLTREPLELPTLDIKLPKGVLMNFIDNEVQDLTWAEIEALITLENYKSHPAIKAKVSV